MTAVGVTESWAGRSAVVVFGSLTVVVGNSAAGVGRFAEVEF